MEEKILILLEKLNNTVEEMRQDIGLIKTQQKEHGQILRALEEKTSVTNAKLESLSHDVAEVQGEVKALRKDLILVERVAASNWSDILDLKSSRL